MKKNVVVFLTFLFAGCNTQEKASRWVIKAQIKQPNVVARICGELYPPVEYVKDSVVYSASNVPREVYIYPNCDSFLKNKTREDTYSMKCPGVVDTIIIFREKQVVNKAKVMYLNEKNNTLVVENELLERSNIVLKRYLIASCLIVLLFIAFKFIKLYKVIF